MPAASCLSRFRRDLEAAAGHLPPRLAVALSGGPDSLALLLLASGAFPGRLAAATVDHGLRAESRAEAEQAAAVCARLHVEHRILTVNVRGAGEGLQAAARHARYAALADWMRGAGLPLLLTGHHSDDQAETLLMRLNRGSGVAGLAGIRARGPVPGATDLLLCRPLLGWRREELAAVVEKEGLTAADDPSNRDPAYDRARLRTALAGLDWIDAPALARSAAALGEAEEALQWIAERLYAARVEAKKDAVELRPDGLPQELLRRLVLACLRAAVAEAHPRGDKLQALIAALQDGRTATLAGVKAAPSAAGRWRFSPAPPRR